MLKKLNPEKSFDELTEEEILQYPGDSYEEREVHAYLDPFRPRKKYEWEED
ncbi:hypothetical protein [Ornithinibacillus californiensis]|uniref:hypothetical protein n=1 Tax=Ornithinibacillus californiensis TaxID=161536 RepID=UPI0012EDC78C|nr:hypothetical protein [Ornithinibacillus californiensis]